MSFDFTPMTDEELDAMGLINEGIYQFVVLKSERQQSKAGNPMAKLQIKIWDNEGKIHILFDYLVFTQINLNIKKIKHFCETCGLLDKYLQGSLPEDLSGWGGKLQIGIEEGKPKSDGTFYPKRNMIIDYVKSEESKQKEVKKDFIDDDVPF